jgi:hypothetical protein
MCITILKDLLACTHQPGQPEIRDLGSELRVQEDVGRLDVSVEDRRVDEAVKVHERIGGLNCDIESGFPR